MTTARIQASPSRTYTAPFAAATRYAPAFAIAVVAAATLYLAPEASGVAGETGTFRAGQTVQVTLPQVVVIGRREAGDATPVNTAISQTTTVADGASGLDAVTGASIRGNLKQ